ncbi:MAG: hypothetical protein M3450_00390 [Actinomycetota bacterium]|nr:hypothetical protein [Actinomycetota bacterium]
MATTLPYPDASQDSGVGSDRGASTGTTRWQKVVGILGLVVVLWVGSEMYDVVFFRGAGPGGGQRPGGGQQAPVESQDQDDGPPPPSGGPHDPSRFGH